MWEAHRHVALYGGRSRYVFHVDLYSSVSTARCRRRALTEQFEGLIPLAREVMASDGVGCAGLVGFELPTPHVPVTGPHEPERQGDGGDG